MKIANYTITLHLVNSHSFHRAVEDIQSLLCLHDKLIQRYRAPNNAVFENNPIFEPSYAEYLTVSAVCIDDNGDEVYIEMPELREDLC